MVIKATIIVFCVFLKEHAEMYINVFVVIRCLYSLTLVKE